MILEYRGIDLWDGRTGAAIIGALGDDIAPPPVAAAWLGANVDPLDLLLGLAVLRSELADNGDLIGPIDEALTVVRQIVDHDAKERA